MLLVNNLSFYRNDILIFEDLNLSIGNGQITQIRGKNGSGKTTFLKVILNILDSKIGEIFWEGKNIKKNIFNFYNETTFIMDQNTSSRKLTVFDNINFWRGLSSSKLNDYDINLLLETFNLKKYKDTKVMYLSTGEVKKLELLRLILEKKKLWILDEPYNHLDDLSIEILNQTFIDHINKDGIILFASHFNPSIENLRVIDFN
ncbi:heme ABC exporter ATP-binding protein CcmA [Pelagibacterales bacterium SAG-MED31]|nr:heme ABC exporter ATP-binding protein CcmA [Pelagibacterales bacterium SAG-MED31]